MLLRSSRLPGEIATTLRAMLSALQKHKMQQDSQTLASSKRDERRMSHKHRLRRSGNTLHVRLCRSYRHRELVETSLYETHKTKHALYDDDKAVPMLGALLALTIPDFGPGLIRLNIWLYCGPAQESLVCLAARSSFIVFRQLNSVNLFGSL